MSNERYSGIVSVFNKFNYAVNNHGKQIPPQDSGIDTFEFWCPERRPAGQNLAMNIQPAIEAFEPDNSINGFTRPTATANAWVAAKEDTRPELTLTWEKPQLIRCIHLYFDTDFDHALESVQMGHPENRIPFCIASYCIMNDKGDILYENRDNHQTINRIEFKSPVYTTALHIRTEHPSPDIPATIFQVWIG
jgi:hypothetical protein